MLYAIQAEGTAFVKIGVTAGETVKARLAELQTACPFKLVVLATADWPNRYERQIHVHLLDHWERGEWFRLCPEVQAVIDDMGQGRRWSLRKIAAPGPDWMVRDRARSAEFVRCDSDQKVNQSH